MDTRTANRPQGGRAEGSDGDPGLYAVKVPTDPARLSSTTASFRVRLGASVTPLIDAQVAAPAFTAPPVDASYPGLAQDFSPDQTQPMLVLTPLMEAGALAGAASLAGSGAGAGSTGYGGEARPRRPRRVTPITLAGGAAPLLDAARMGGAGPDASTTVLPVQQSARPSPTTTLDGGAARRTSSAAETQLMPQLPVPPNAGDGYGQGLGHAPGGYDDEVTYVGGRQPWGSGPEYQLEARESGEPVRHAWYPGRRVDLGLVLLPLRIFLGGISIYAGFSKVSDPVYFDGGVRGSMMHWLQSLHPWPMAQPLMQFALAHPVGAGLAVAFIQIVVGVLSILGLWQRLAAGTAMLLSVALLVTVSWRTTPAYDAPDIIFLAAWSPLLLAGAPLFSLDGRLAIEAWHRLGERTPVSVLRRRVLRRGFVVATVVIGSTLLLGSALGAAVRDHRIGTTVAPDQSGLPTDYPSPVYPSGGAQSPTGHGPAGSSSKAPSASHSPSAAPTTAAPSHRPTSRHSGSTSSGSSSAGGQGGSSPSGGSSSTPSHHHSSTPSPKSSSGSTNGVIGGLLGTSAPAPLPLLGMPGNGAGTGGTGGNAVT
ncbi:DoxX family protein [Streptacidiphilus carbonis]|uniref:DoxX family protein n=1 Tax=Streptacidiphilus carbonis TaxID=105422 RepID=UPI000694CDD4|nr:DoxX family membrane protein [Streptacidiphilus carbonis]